MQYIAYLINQNILILKIDLSGVLNFVLGIITGFILLLLVLVWLMTSDNRKKVKERFQNKKPLDDKTVYDMVLSKQDRLTETVRLTDNAYFKVAFDLSMELAQEIARYYYPEAKYPIYELSVEELLTLNYYITKRIETIVNGKFLRHFKRNRISKIINILNAKKAVDNSKLMKLSRKYKVSQLLTIGKAVLNYANPVFWFRKLAIKPTTTLVTKEVCKFIIEIVGEETNKIYSKTIFKVDESDDEVIAKFDKLIEEEGEDEDVFQEKE